MEPRALDYRRIVELVERGQGGTEGISAKELADRLGLEAVPAKVEGMRSKAKRPVETGLAGGAADRPVHVATVHRDRSDRDAVVRARRRLMNMACQK
ncbi:hypothetical protein ACFY7F_36605 [Streptomyces griseofuscus]|uniref:hypothetical protein n=1 Tax=Streptomyces griseofuscus TaxID=146922 RepID=UPI00368A3F86